MPIPNPDIPNIPNTPDVGMSLSFGPARPVVLFPVRVETRFFSQADGSSELRVRVYPDTVHIDSHEPGLTADELTWGRHFWEQTWRAGNDEERAKAAWRQLADRFDTPRAAWVARALKPLNLADRPANALAANQPLPKPLRFPSPATKAETWMRAPETRVLPNLWIVLGYKDGRLVVNIKGGVIPDTLATGPDPSPSADTDQVGIDQGMKWMVDFDEAEKVGMGIRAKLAREDTVAGLDFLLVMGIKDSPGGTTDWTPRLAELFDAHHYTGGLGFVPPGTPSNNTQDAPSGFSSKDPGHEASYLAERSTLAFKPGDRSNADVLTTALGLTNAGPVFANLPNATAKDQLDARHMNTALWQATWGYFLLQMLGVGETSESPLTDDDLAWVRGHFIDYVRASGPLPTVRIGKQPYGVLPVTSLNAWKPLTGQESQSQRDAVLRDFLIRLRDLWRRNYPDIPRLGRSDDVGKDLAEVLSMEGWSSSYSIRHLMGRHYAQNLWSFLNADLDASGWWTKQEELTTAVLRTLNITWRPRLARAVFAPPVTTLNGALVQLEQPAANAALTPNYIESLLAARDLNAIGDGTVQQPPPHTLLYLLLRHAMLLEYAAAASRLLVLQPALRREPELVNLAEGQSTQTVWQQMQTKFAVQGVAEPMTVGKYLLGFTPTGEPDVAREPDLKPLSDFRASLAHLKLLDTDRLEQLLTGTLDLCSHRLDAWITSLATKRLTEMRQADTDGVLFGGYGWVMNLTPAPAPTPVAPPPGESEPVFEAANNPGFIHTPSLTQATTVAVLRSGHLSHSANQTSDGPLAIDLSSERVRLATWLLDGVRQGQPLGALLGYRFERSLHERGLAQFIAGFRRIAPFGELLKAEVALKDAEDAVMQLRTDLASAEDALTPARKRHEDLLGEQAALPERIATAERAAERLNRELKDINEEIKTGEDAIDHAERTNKPKEFIDALKERLDRLQADRDRVERSRDGALERAKQARERIVTIPGDIAIAAIALQQAEQRVIDLRAALKAAEDTAKAAKEHYQQLLDQYRRDFLFPDTADQRALESVAADQVVDGLKLHDLWQETQTDPLTREQRERDFFSKLPQMTEGEKQEVRLELIALHNAIDAVSDALMAESVYQVVRGNPLRAASTVDSIAGGETPPPELEVARTPRTGIALTHRLVTLFSGEPVRPPPEWPRPANPFRTDAEPHLNAWAAKLLGNPVNVCCVVERLEPATGQVLEVKELRLNELHLAPLDLIYAVEGGQGGQQAEIEQCILYTIMRRKTDGFAPGSRLRVNPSRKPEWKATELSYGEFSEILRTARRLIAGVRGIDASDVNPPERSTNFSVDVEELEKRAAGAGLWLDRTKGRLRQQLAKPDTANLEVLREFILRSAGFGVAGAVPLSAAGDSPADRQTLLTQAGSIHKELVQRAEQLVTLIKGFDVDKAKVEDKRDHALAQLHVIFGKVFVVLPRFTAANAAELDQALADSAKLQDGDPFAATTWFQRMARVRDGVARLNAALQYTEALKTGEQLKLTIAQLPYGANDRWVGLPLTAEQSLPGGKLSLAVQSAAPVDVRQPLAGLLIDEWVEVVPSATETTGIALQYDQPNAAPPQTILVAVPPELESPWTVWSLQQVLLETLDLARIRAVDPDALDEVGHYLPALYFALNLAGDTVSTDFTTIK